MKVTGEGSNRQREKIERQREAVPVTEVGSQCKLTFKMPGTKIILRYAISFFYRIRIPHSYLSVCFYNDYFLIYFCIGPFYFNFICEFRRPNF